MVREWRIYHPALDARVGEEVELSAEEAHHVRTVLRLGEGESVRLFDGRGGEWKATVSRADRGGVVVRRGERLSEATEARLEVAIFQGLCRAERMEWVIQKATEIGVAAIHPLGVRRAKARDVTPRQLRRWLRIAVEAAKQSGRQRIPEITPREEIPRAESGESLAILLHTAPDAPSFSSVLERAGTRPERVWLAVGSESGFSDEEIRGAVSLGWVLAGLGPRILRAETASLVAATIALHRWNDLG